MNLSIPTIHSNGTSFKEITENLEKACVQIAKTRDCLENTQPNRRDYYPQGEAEFYKARHEHMQRSIKLEEVRKELEFIWEKLTENI